MSTGLNSKSHLIPVQRIVVKDGKTFTQTFYVSPAEAASSKDHTSVGFENPEQFKEFSKKLSTEQRQEIIEHAKKSGLNWKENPAFNVNWMRAAMAIGAKLKGGGNFSVPAFKNVSAAKPAPAQPKTPAIQPTSVTPVAVSGSFTNREDFKAFCKKLSTEQRRGIMKDAEAQGVTWTRVASNPATDWMRCAMAIGAILQSGKGYTVGSNKPEPKPVVVPTPAPAPVTPKLNPAPVVAPTPAPAPVPAPAQASATVPAPAPTPPPVSTAQPAAPAAPAQPDPLEALKNLTDSQRNFLKQLIRLHQQGSDSKPTEVWVGANGYAKVKIEQPGKVSWTNLPKVGNAAPSSASPTDPSNAKYGYKMIADLGTLPANAPASNGTTTTPAAPAAPVSVPTPASTPTPTPAAAPTAPASKLEELANKLGLSYRMDNGAVQFGLPVRVTNKWGKEEMAPGSIRMVSIEPKPALGPGNWVKLDSNFLDKDKVKEMGVKWGGTADPSDKSWYLPFKDFIKVPMTFKNVEISKEIAPIIAAVLDKVPDLQQLIDNAKPHDPSANLNANKDIDISNFVMPKGMNPQISLYDHQKKGVRFLLQNRRTVLGLAVGLGKTLTAITAAQELVNKGEIKRMIVVAPASVKFNWKQEVEGFSGMKACVLESNDLSNPKKKQMAWDAAGQAQVIIVNYDMLRKDDIRDKLQMLAPDCIIADEAHKLKNNSQQTKGFKETWKNAKYKWFLTATPFPNGQPKETYNMLAHLRPEVVGRWTGGKDSFGANYVVWENGSFGAKAVKLKNVDKLQKKMEDVVFVRTHTSPDVTSKMPKERHTTFNLEMEPEQKKLYNAVSAEIKTEIERLEKMGIAASSPVMIAKMKKLEQIAIDPDMLQTDPLKVDMHKLYPKEEWAVNTITDHLEDPANGGVILFCDMKMPLDKIKMGLVDNKVDPKQIAYITGDVKPAERTAISEKLQKGEVKVVLCTNAAEEGVNLQKGAHTLIHLDVPWVPKSITQREGRVLRQGQTNDFAQFYTPIITGTVEDTKRGKLGMKVSTIEDLLGRGSSGSVANNMKSDASAEKLSLKDIKNILGGV